MHNDEKIIIEYKFLIFRFVQDLVNLFNYKLILNFIIFFIIHFLFSMNN